MLVYSDICFMSNYVLSIAFPIFQADLLVTREKASGPPEKIIGIDNIEWCKTVKMIEDNKFLSIIVAELQKTPMGIYLDVCKRTGDFIAYNISFQESQYAQMWPDGDYKLNALFYDKIDREIMNFTYTARVARTTGKKKN